MKRQGIGLHNRSHAEAKKIKSPALHTHDSLRASYRDPA